MHKSGIDTIKISYSIDSIGMPEIYGSEECLQDYLEAEERIMRETGLLNYAAGHSGMSDWDWDPPMDYFDVQQTNYEMCREDKMERLRSIELTLESVRNSVHLSRPS